jgi:hypothetical protein
MIRTGFQGERKLLSRLVSVIQPQLTETENVMSIGELGALGRSRCGLG